MATHSRAEVVLDSEKVFEILMNYESEGSDFTHMDEVDEYCLPEHIVIKSEGVSGDKEELQPPSANRVSSVLNRDVKQYGKKYLFDECEETCWNSDQGSPQWIAIELESAEAIYSFKIQFQGGFAGSKCHLEAGMVAGDMENVESFYPEDVNSVQTFQLTKPVTAKYIKFVFESSTDFFGRIIIYKLEVFGSP